MNQKERIDFGRPPQSYWIASTLQNNYSALDHDLSVDLAIIGGGAVGISTAYMLCKKGLRIAILEADGILHGTTGHTTAKITSQHGLIYHKIESQIGMEQARQYADANETAIKTITQIIQENRINCDFLPQSSYIYTNEDDYIEQIGQESMAAAALGIEASYLDKIPLPFSVKAAVKFDHQAQFHPLKYFQALTTVLTKCGCEIYEQTRIVGIEKGSPYTLTTNSDKKITAEKVVIASHYPFYNKPRMYFARLWADKSYAIAIKAKEAYPGGMYISAEEPGRSFRRLQCEDEELVIIGGEHHKTGLSKDTNYHYQALADYANEIFTVKDIPYRWSTQDCMTLDSIPYVGQFKSSTPNLLIATGFGKWGMTNSVASSLLLKDLILAGSSPWQEVYAPSRHTIAASTKTFLVQNASVAHELLKGKLSHAPKEFSMEPGEGKIVKIDGKKAGVYKDESGNLHIVNTTCPHMGCELVWNPAEHSWDCPCHGSRFSIDGDIIEGPAVKHLDKNNEVNTLEKVLKDDF
jgi:glycine/D-amino acid oxidase-like deaminating enzyme/nitrite reductase/ring-hydroxylating ferredoxin subunit